MRPSIPIILLFLLVTAISASTPINIHLSYHSGYDSNVMRFSQKEIQNAADDRSMMGGAGTFDSYVSRVNTRLQKTLFVLGKKELGIASTFNLSNYVHNNHKNYWSGNASLVYKWGSYRNLKYTLRHLNSYYLRHYVDRDISKNNLSACFFTDRDQSMFLTLPAGRRFWYTFGTGYLQRYYDIPFTEFDLDIYYFRLKVNKRIKNLGTVSFQVDRASAENTTYKKTAVSSDFDRSYESVEWYLPIKFDRSLNYFDHIGVSLRQELRVYKAEALDDVLHSGRNHRDMKIDFWINKSVSERLDITLSSRFRARNTDSSYEWVKDLKSFKQIQLWCKIKWAFTYDKY